MTWSPPNTALQQSAGNAVALAFRSSQRYTGAPFRSLEGGRLNFAVRPLVPPMDISSIYVHDGRLLRVVEDAHVNTLTMEVELPASPDSDELVPRRLVFEDVYGYRVSGGPFDGIPEILGIEVVGTQGRWRRVRIETNAGYRELFCTQVRVLEQHPA
jgi:hypothetical protein